MSVQVVIAVRGGSGAKSRLESVLGPQERVQLAQAMLQDMLDAVALCPSVDGAWVVTPDEASAQAAREAGAGVIEETPGRGLNGAFEDALAVLEASEPGAAAALLLGDLPLLDPVELDGAVACLASHPVILVPAVLDGGTGALILRPGVQFTPRFGADSLARHQDEAARRGLAVGLFPAPSLGRDLDRPEDIEAVIARGPGTRTAALLSRLR
jgi:2-phospho-L-lactate guanylyltransferase